MIPFGKNTASHQNPALGDIVGLMRNYLQPESASPLKFMASDKEVFQLARTLGLMSHICTSSVRNSFSPQVQPSLKRAYLYHVAHFSRLAGHFHDLLDDFAHQGIAVIPFKGLVLSQMLYGDPAFRLCTDIDLMVRSADIVRATALLQDSGYEISSTQLITEFNRLISRLDYLEFENRHNGVLVDLQWQKVKSYCPGPLSEEALFCSTQSIEFMNKKVMVFSNAISLYFLCTHGARSSWCELRTLVDLAMAMTKWDDTVWQKTAALMWRNRIETMMMTGTLLAHQLFNIPLPAAVASGIDLSVLKLANRIRQRWNRNGFVRPEAWERFHLDLLFRKGGWQKAQYLSFRMLPKKFDLIKGKNAGSLLYAKRLMRILKETANWES